MTRDPDVLDRLAPLFEPPGRGFEDLLLRWKKRQRVRKIGAIALVTAIAIAFVAVGLRTVGSHKHQPAVRTGAHFEWIHGWIVYREAGDLVAVDPADPTNRISLGVWNKTLNYLGLDHTTALQPIGWSKDGNRLLGRRVVSGGYADSFADLYVVNSEGTEVRLTMNGDAAWGSISPDGTRVVYTNQHDRSLYTIDALGGEPKLIERHAREPFIESPAWSPDGSRIALLDWLEESSMSYGLTVLNSDGSGRVVENLDLGVGLTALDLVWSPDGSRLALFSVFGRNYSGGSGRIYVVDTKTWKVHQLTNGGDSRWPTWSPDGSRIAFVRDGQLFTMRSDGGDVQKVDGVEPEPNTSIAWNPGDVP